MRFKFILFIFLVFLSCSQKNDKKLTDQSLTSMLDAGRYEEMIQYLEPELSKNPGDKTIAMYLAKAHLGMAGFEVLKLTSKVLGSQTVSNQVLQRLIPGCDLGVMGKFDLTHARCLLLRLLNNLPSIDDAHFKRALEIFRQNFPVENQLDESSRILIGVVEASGVIVRAGGILLRYEALDPVSASDDEIEWFFREISTLAVDTQHTLARVRDLEVEVSSALSGNIRTILFQQSPKSQFIEQTAIPKIIALNDPKPGNTEQELIRTYLIQKLDDAVEILKNPER